MDSSVEMTTRLQIVGRAAAQASYDLHVPDDLPALRGQYRPEPPADAYLPLVPTRGFLSSIGGGWRYAKGTSYAKSISPEDAEVISIVGKYTSPYLGSYVLDDENQAQPFEQFQLTGEVREYRTAPWIPNHVIAGKLAVGASFGTRRYGSYQLGGSFGESSAYTLPDEWRALRGFPASTAVGDWYYLGSLEYRLPLAYIDRGVGTIPFFARYLSAAAFVDAGNASSPREGLGAPSDTWSEPGQSCVARRSSAGATVRGRLRVRGAGRRLRRQPRRVLRVARFDPAAPRSAQALTDEARRVAIGTAPRRSSAAEADETGIGSRIARCQIEVGQFEKAQESLALVKEPALAVYAETLRWELWSAMADWRDLATAPTPVGLTGPALDRVHFLRGVWSMQGRRGRTERASPEGPSASGRRPRGG
jgi:hypothetical protein